MDTSSKYFHTKVNRRKSRNNIDSIQGSDNNWLHSRDQISQHLTQHFKNISTTSNPVIEEGMYSIFPTIISEEDNLSLTKIPTDEEIHSTLKSMENWSAPGSEGFQAGFYKSQWSIVGEDVCLMVKKMKPLMETIISPFQAAYVSERLISDNTVIAQEIIHSMKKKRVEIGWLALKLDMSKSFDSTTTLLVILNGSPCDDFSPSRGIRQGDPLSPYLFILVMEFLSRQLSTAQMDKTIKGIKLAALSPAINHLLFADGCLIFSQANLSSVNNLLELLQNFSTQSGQVINFEKSAVHFSKEN
ncbi:uncharacterized protein LOC113338903 [Papaver somniferum]|uniref:uncharacterized protein LOC113338903 n=1 Tax=Papaver somniferum TaxID=3469 RepID=UPI000E6F9D02|nr:uncharacterized protein LOC113338903 [Papaver somniferum]